MAEVSSSTITTNRRRKMTSISFASQSLAFERNWIENKEVPHLKDMKYIFGKKLSYIIMPGRFELCCQVVACLSNLYSSNRVLTERCVHQLSKTKRSWFLSLVEIEHILEHSVLKGIDLGRQSACNLIGVEGCD